MRCVSCLNDICYKDGELWSFKHHACGEDGLLGFIRNVCSHYCCTDATVEKDWKQGNQSE